MAADGDRLTPSIALPKGGGAVRGIGETFQHDAFSGTATWRVPIPVSPGRGGFGPELALSYGSGAGNGPFGLGWELALPRIARKTELGLPRYDDRDTFVMSGAEDLVPLLGRDGRPEKLMRGPFAVERFRPRIEGLFARIERWMRAVDGDVHWRATTRANVTSVYGRSPGARIADPADGRRVFAWLLEESFDARGNHILYEYAGDDPALRLADVFEDHRAYAQRYLRRIFYVNLPASAGGAGGAAVGLARSGVDPANPSRVLERRYAIEVVFDYADIAAGPAPAAPTTELLGAADPPLRPDPFSTYRPGFELRTLRRCARVLVYHRFAELGGPTLVRSTRFAYRTDPETRLSLLESMVVAGHRREGARDIVAEMPPVSFRYGAFRPQEQRFRNFVARGVGLPAASMQSRDIALIDLFGDGAPDLVQSTPVGWRYWRNLGEGEFDEPRTLAAVPAGVRLADPGVALADVDGDGRPELVLASNGLSGFFRAGDAEPFARFVRFPAAPPFAPDDANLRLVDLTGDGRTDALLFGDRAVYWFENRGADGFAAAEQLPRLADLDEFPDVSFADPAGRVHLADMNGDGLTDIVLVHQGRVDYWPNLGYGRFGRRITMASVLDPPGLSPGFDPKRMLLADVNGTGCADLVYVDVDRVHLWFNRSGNAWSAPATIDGTPQAVEAGTVRAADVFGTGTASLAWSYDFGLFPGPHYKAIDLCGGVKPYLLEEMDNGLGAVTRVGYAPSTRFALADARAGAPVATRLPFPVQVVARVETIDRVGRTRLVSLHAYHHGHFDAAEREFRGFARVERLDGESFESFAGAPLEAGAPAAENARAEHHVPPTLTIAWHHTGAFREEGERLMAVLAREFYAGDGAVPALRDHDVDEADAPAEAHRALRGAVLRTETYALDGSPREPHPFTVESAAFAVRALQPRGDRVRGVFLRTTRESLAIHYERNPADPRVTHTHNLAVDEFGNVTRSAVVAYPRRVAAEPEQGRTLATLAAARFINTPATLPSTAPHHFVGVPVETRGYEIAHAEALPTQHGLLTAAALAALAADPDDFLPLESAPAGSAKILLEWTRNYFRRDDAAALLPAPNRVDGRLALGAIEPLGLPFETCRAILTPGLRAALYGATVGDAGLRAAGYVDSATLDAALPPAAGGLLWARGARETTDPAAFCMPVRMQDPFGNVATVEHDRYALALVRTVDPLGNEIRGEIDYRVLEPHRVIDPNGNQARVAFDALGFVAGSARVGKDGEGDTLAGFVTDLDTATIDAFFADPVARAAALLSGASMRVVYDFNRPRRGRGPAAAATIAREMHASATGGAASPVQISIAHSDGAGRVAQTKSLTSPGDVEGVPTAERWIGNGWTVFNNKGAAVQTFEPFFSITPAFEFAAERGVTATTFYDSAGRSVAVLRADGAYEKTVFGPWEQAAWDANDTVSLDPKTDPEIAGLVARFLSARPGFRTWLRRRLPDPARPPSVAARTPEQDAAVKAMAHAGTPTVQLADPLGRPFLTVAYDGAHRLATRVALDVRGNSLAIVDPRGIVAFRHVFDMASRKLRTDSVDAGRRTLFLAVDDRPLLEVDAIGHRTSTAYDAGRRPVEVRVARDGAAETVVLRTVYGESLGAAAAAGNHRTRILQVFDGVGEVASVAYDFKGNLRESVRRLLPNHRRAADWSRDSIPAAADSFRRRMRFDALDRPIEDVAPDGSVTTRRYDKTGRPFAIDVAHRGAATRTLIAAIAYNARGQRERITYGNGVASVFGYDPETFRTTAIRATRGTAVLQHLAYAYDPVGNVTTCADRAFETVFNGNERVDPVSTYAYDAFYRLVAATGREHEALGPCGHDRDWATASPCSGDAGGAGLIVLTPQPVNNGRALRNWRESYVYDDAGNLLEIRHVAGARGSWTRRQTVDGASNRLLASDAGCPGEAGFAVPHDANGNVGALRHLPLLRWDHANRLAGAMLRGGGGASDEAFYGYDGSGMRARKVIERGGTPSCARLYLGGFEVFLDHATGADPATRETLHVMDGAERLAVLEAWTESGREERRVRLQFANHLGSARLELDELGRTISYEEYRPYGDTAYTAGGSRIEVARKRYRYSGKERDDETGLYYFGARYYASWMARWLACDPAAEAGGLNLYVRARGNPIAYADHSGLVDEPAKSIPRVTQTSPPPTVADAAPAGNPGIRRGEWVFEGTRFAVREVITGTWSSAAAQAEGTGYPKESGYGAYLDLVRGEDVRPLPNPDLIEPGDLLLIPIASEGQFPVPADRPAPPEDLLSEVKCQSLGDCKVRFGIDVQRDSGPLERFEASKVDFGLENGPGFDATMQRSSWRVPWGTVSGEVLTATATNRLSGDWKNDSIVPTDLDFDFGAKATAAGIGTVVGSKERNVSGGLSLGPSLGLKLQGHGVEGGREQYSMDVDVAFFNLGFTYTTDPKSP